MTGHIPNDLNTLKRRVKSDEKDAPPVCGRGRGAHPGAVGVQLRRLRRHRHLLQQSEQWANWGAVLDAFSDETGIDAPSDDKNSGKVMAALESEKGSPAGDTAYYGITFGMEAQEAGLVAPFEHERLADIPDTLKADDGSWFTVHHGAVAFLVNTEAIGDVAVPQCWEDLTKPEYRGLVSWLDPATAAVGQSVVTAANLALGGDFDNWQPAIDWANAVKGDGALQLPTETATNQLAQGEIPILIDADFNGYQIAQAQNARSRSCCRVRDRCRCRT